MYKWLYLKFQTVDMLVTTVHYSLVVIRSCNGSWGATIKPQNWSRGAPLACTACEETLVSNHTEFREVSNSL